MKLIDKVKELLPLVELERYPPAYSVKKRLEKIIADYEQHGDWTEIHTEADLPKEKCRYLVQYKILKMRTILFYVKPSADYWLREIEAWQPLPPQYRAE